MSKRTTAAHDIKAEIEQATPHAVRVADFKP
jgi:hypothetical protein